MNKIEKGTCDKFRTNLLMYSKSKDYETAKNEWSLTCSYIGEDYCICGHLIHNVFVIENIHSGITLNVGEDCIEYFLFDQLGGELAKEHGIKDSRVVALSEIYKLDKSIQKIVHLEQGKSAYRNNKKSKSSSK